MKTNLKPVAIIAIIALFALSWYSLFNSSIKTQFEYDNYIKVAREKAELGILEDAEINYKSALGLKDSLKLREEIAQFFYDNDKLGAYTSYLYEIIEIYPLEAVGYERLAAHFKETNNIYTSYKIMENTTKRNIKSEKLTNIYNELAYEYELTYSSFPNIGIYSSGYYAAQKEDGLWGYVSAYGNTKISYNFLEAGIFTSSGYAPVKTQQDIFVLITNSGNIKFVDAEKKEIEDCTPYISEKMAIKINGKYSYANNEFKILFGEYDYAGSFYNGVAAVIDGGTWYIINEKGEKVGSETFNEIKVDDKGIAFRNDVAFAKQGDSYILIDKNGKRVSEDSWEDAKAFSSDQPTAVKKDGKWGFVDPTGKEIMPPMYDDAKPFVNSLAAVQEKGKWGFADLEKKEVVISPAFDDASDFTDNGSTFVKIGDSWRLLKIFRLCYTNQ